MDAQYMHMRRSELASMWLGPALRLDSVDVDVTQLDSWRNHDKAMLLWGVVALSYRLHT